MPITSRLRLSLLLAAASSAWAACDPAEPAPVADSDLANVELRDSSGRVLRGEPALVTLSELAPERVEVAISASDDLGWWTFTAYVPVAEWERGFARLELTDRPAGVGQANSGEYSDPSEPSRWAPGGTVELTREGGRISGSLAAAPGFLTGRFQGASESSCFLTAGADAVSAELDPGMEASFCRPVRDR